MKRSLIFYTCPFAANEQWLANVNTVKRYIDQFNGSIVVCVATGEGLHPPQIVKDTFAGAANIEWLLVDDDPELGEAAGFIPSMRIIAGAADNDSDITFYCHTKGVSPDKTPSELEQVRVWRDLMYAYCLADPLRIETILERWPCCGCFKKYGAHHLPTAAPWHYSGTFFWFRNDRIFSQNGWDRVAPDRFAVEGYLSRFIPAEQAFCLFADDPRPSDLYAYSTDAWKRLYDLPAHGRWRRKHRWRRALRRKLGPLLGMRP